MSKIRPHRVGSSARSEREWPPTTRFSVGLRRMQTAIDGAPNSTAGPHSSRSGRSKDLVTDFLNRMTSGLSADRSRPWQ